MVVSSTDTEQLQRRNRELSILNVIAEGLNRETDLARALQTTLERVVELFDLRTGWIWLTNEQTEEFYLAAALNLPPALANNPKRMEGWCYCQEIYEAGELRDAANISIIRCTRLQNRDKDARGLRNHASVPLDAHTKRLGILNVVSGDWRELAADDLRLLSTIADLLSIAIERARLFARSAQLGALEERARLAREIHDTVAQGLSATALRLETADALLEAGADPAKVRGVVEQALQLTRANLEETRRSVLDLRAAPLEGRAFSDVLPDLVGQLTAATDIEPSIEIVGAPYPLPVRVEIGLYRITQEAIANVIRHAEATRLAVHMTVTPERVELRVEDNGKGFDPAQVPKGRFGLIGINERARLLGGTAVLCSEPGIGTSIRVVIPLGGEA